MKNEKWSKVLSYVLVALISAAVTVTVMLGIFVYRQQGQSKLETLERLIDEYFIGDADKEAMEDAAASAMIASLGDRWSYYIPADEYDAYMEQINNAYVGIGVTITPEEDGGIRIIAVVADGPADEAGIKVDDVIVKVGDRSILDMSLDDSKKLIQGEENTKVNLTIRRGEEELAVEVTRRAIHTPVATWELLDNGIGLVTIANFNANCASETIAAIEAVMEEGADKIIFDVRNNPGGYATELVKILDYLLPEGKLFTTVDYNQKEQTDMSDAKCLDVPMAVLVNGSSYSAAEFFAAALSEYDAAVVVGEKTSGKGYFQTMFRLPDGSAVGLSIGKYYTPNGKSLENVGITPDVSVSSENLTGNMEPMDDPQIVAAVNALLS